VNEIGLEYNQFMTGKHESMKYMKKAGGVLIQKHEDMKKLEVQELLLL